MEKWRFLGRNDGIWPKTGWHQGQGPDFLCKRRNALTRWVSRHSNFDAPAAEIQLPLNFGWSLLSMYASATCSTSVSLVVLLLWMVVFCMLKAP
jgi:hypothetical protein